MKEAAGEANITVITIVLIAVVLAVGTPLINSVLNRTSRNACCQAAGGKIESDNSCHNVTNGDLIPFSSYWDDTNKKCTVK